MLNRAGPFDEERLIEALKGYLPYYGRKDREVCEVPYKDLDLGKVMVAKFMWLAQQWVFVESNPRN